MVLLDFEIDLNSVLIQSGGGIASAAFYGADPEFNSQNESRARVEDTDFGRLRLMLCQMFWVSPWYL